MRDNQHPRDNETDDHGATASGAESAEAKVGAGSVDESAAPQHGEPTVTSGTVLPDSGREPVEVTNEPAADVLVLDVGRRGVRALRTGVEPHATVEVPPEDQATVRIPSATDIVAAVTPLVEARHEPPVRVVASVHQAALTVNPNDLRARLTAAALAPTCVVDALVTTLFGALQEVSPGTVVDLGGSTAGLATDLDQVWHRLDGWGPVLGHRGSATWVGIQGLSAGLQATDGVPGGSERLLNLGRETFGDESNWPALMDEAPARTGADFAGQVAEAAREGDEVAQQIVRHAGEHIADLLAAGLSVVPDQPIAATGELLMIDAVKVSIASALGKRRLILTPALEDALTGARLVAEHLAAGGELPHRPPFVYLQGPATLGR